MTRTIFIITVLIILVIVKSKNSLNKIIITLFLLTLAFLMGLTRVYLGEHWTSDVIGGSILGAGFGFFASGLILRPKLV